MPGMTIFTIKRQPRGIPVGGQFAAHDRSESSISLDATAPTGFEEDDRDGWRSA